MDELKSYGGSVVISDVVRNRLEFLSEVSSPLFVLPDISATLYYQTVHI